MVLVSILLIDETLVAKYGSSAFVLGLVPCKTINWVYNNNIPTLKKILGRFCLCYCLYVFDLRRYLPELLIHKYIIQVVFLMG